ncbi:MAG: 16S rRNA processing protein RimM [Desulfobacteraceae bacterium]|nr:16S rRNA processing protein RimM [Desulfobacteraceae bacterium]
MSQVSPGSLLLVGKVIRPHGREGLLRISSFARSEDSFLQAGRVFLKSASGEIREYAVISVRPHKNSFLMKLEGFPSRREAEEYRGAEIHISKDALRREEGEYFWHELLGLKVYLETGKYLGIISQIIPTRSNDIYVVKKGDKEVLLPATHQVVKEIDLDNEKMVVADMEGLFDLNEI